MTDNTSFLTIILYVMLAIMFALAVALIFIYLNMKVKEKQKEKEDSAVAESKPVKKSSSKTFKVFDEDFFTGLYRKKVLDM